MRQTRVARRYAMALMTADNSALERTSQDLARVGELLRDSREFRVFVASPVVKAEKKVAVVRELFDKTLAPETVEFLLLLIKKNREAHLPEVIVAFEALRDEQMGIVNADVTTAIACTKPQEAALSQQLERYTGKKVRARFAVDTAIRGGLVVRIGDTVLDASIRHQLEMLRIRLAAGSASN